MDAGDRWSARRTAAGQWPPTCRLTTSAPVSPWYMVMLPSICKERRVGWKYDKDGGWEVLSCASACTTHTACKTAV